MYNYVYVSVYVSVYVYVYTHLFQWLFNSFSAIQYVIQSWASIWKTFGKHAQNMVQHCARPCHAAMPNCPASTWGTASELVALEAVPGGSDPIQVDVVPGRQALHLSLAA